MYTEDLILAVKGKVQPWLPSPLKFWFATWTPLEGCMSMAWYGRPLILLSCISSHNGNRWSLLWFVRG
ncbi:hypothetical protein GOBAR_AA24605 [Gossypium barbadense]|uniref:Uncharacterized protein n=2 Tax=Gossypium TaxID=3633 RepID=A0A2P5WYB1_GOSBA|nr:hypothetical protein GOBAR_AA24605 [Gossypium barbadense]TYI43691.1 hypothetical protein ES332_A01G186400v1 [Gossypium tomentosum]